MTAREWKPGDVAMVTYRLGQCTERNLCAKSDKGWDCLAPGVGFLMHGEVIDARPVVVIDPEDREQVGRFTEMFRQHYWDGEHDTHTDAGQAALREFVNPTPPKPDEPTGQYAVIEDGRGREWVRIDSTGFCWQLLGQPSAQSWYERWDGIDAVRVLSEGVTA